MWTKQDISTVAIYVSIVLSSVLASFTAGSQFGRYQICREAIDSGVAEYYLDSDYQKKFRWISPEKNKKSTITQSE